MSHPFSPTAILPALATLDACGAARVQEALTTLKDVYFPRAPSCAVPALRRSLSKTVPPLRAKRAARFVHYDGVPDSGYASAEEDEDDGTHGESLSNAMDEDDVEEAETLSLLRSDELERGYAIAWLTGLVKRGDAWVSGTTSSEEQTVRTARLEDAARLVARFAGDDAPEEAVTRTFVFPLRDRCPRHLRDASPAITVELNDAPVDGSDHTAVGLQSWGSAVVFAARLCLDPERYLGSLRPFSSAPGPTCVRRVLELGAGTGLLSVVAAQVLARGGVLAEIDATDHHPDVLENLARNVRRNPDAVGLRVRELDWCAEDDVDAQYDIVLAADVVYHPEHAGWIQGCVARQLGRDGVFWMIIPVRTTGRHEGMVQCVEEAFPALSGEEGSGERLAIVGREDVGKVDGVGRADEGGYTLFEIRWV